MVVTYFQPDNPWTCLLWVKERNLSDSNRNGIYIQVSDLGFAGGSMVKNLPAM